jgi:protein required for attachment to host cells
VHHKYEPHFGASQYQELFFTHQLAQWLEVAVNENAFDRLVLIAAPRTLGNLRKSLSKRVHAHVVAEISKVMTKHTEEMLCKELSHVLL